MSTNQDRASKLAFTSQCVPGSPAEQQEAERLAEFQRSKAERLAQEELDKPEAAAQREIEFQNDRERLSKKRTTTYHSPR